MLYRILEMSKQDGTTFVMVTHEPDLAACADRIITILDGQVQSNVVQSDEVKQKARDELFATIRGNLEIGGAAAREADAPEKPPAPAGAEKAKDKKHVYVKQ